MSDCHKRDRLKQAYLQAVNEYGEAVSLTRRAIRSLDDNRVRHLAQQRYEQCRSALQAFKDHVDQHGCSD